MTVERRGDLWLVQLGDGTWGEVRGFFDGWARIYFSRHNGGPWRPFHITRQLRDQLIAAEGTRP